MMEAREVGVAAPADPILRVIGVLGEELGRERGRRAQTQLELARSNDMIRTLRAENARTRREVMSLTSQVELDDRDIAILRSRIEELNNQVHAYAEQVTIEQSRVRDSDQKLAEMRRELRAARKAPKKARR